MSRREQLITLLHKGPATFPQITASLGISRQRACGLLALARKAGLIERTGTRRHYEYRLPVDASRVGLYLQGLWK